MRRRLSASLPSGLTRPADWPSRSQGRSLSAGGPPPPSGPAAGPVPPGWPPPHGWPPAPSRPSPGWPVVATQLAHVDPAPPWPGARHGLPATGPGAVATLGRRLGARAVDVALMVPVFVALASLGIALVAPHAGPLFPKVRPDDGPVPVPGIFWIELTFLACVAVTGLVLVAYEALATAAWGRTLGKRWLHIRPVRTDGGALDPWQAVGRALLYWAFVLVPWAGLFDPLWCTWDEDHQCLHTKVAGTLVVNDPAVPPCPLRDLRASPTAVPDPR